MFRADLHCHSDCSDGTLSPVEIISSAKRNGLSGLSITDHDTLEAYETAIPAAKQNGILLGSGVELSCSHKNMSVHILGYDFLLDSNAIKEVCTLRKAKRFARNRKILKKLERFNMFIPESELEKMEKLNKTVGRPHIAQIMVEKGYVKSIKDAFSYYLGDGKPCYDPGEPFSVQEGIDAIHKASGKAFIAHPHLIEDRQLLQEILRMNFNGIECYYAKFTPEKEKRWLKIAKERNWLVSGGSDFHGDVKPQIALGSSWVDEAAFYAIFQHVL
ncbi:MAG TPA: PHP domain-containing protein [Rhabdochlamydiaceae bacterium]|nr:PHP domain-containing protein [Rhabdochlamydiaceae bacterium]